MLRQHHGKIPRADNTSTNPETPGIASATTTAASGDGTGNTVPTSTITTTTTVTQEKSATGSHGPGKGTGDPGLGPDAEDLERGTGDHGLGTGAVAGVAVGCMFVGLLVGFLVAWLLLKHRRHDHKPRRRRQHALSSRQEQAEKLIVVPHSKVCDTASSLQPTGIQLNEFLLDACPDREITSEIHALGQLIEQHVEGHYHMQEVQSSPEALSQAAASLGLGQRGSLNAEIITTLAMKPSTRLVAIRHVLSFVLFTSIDFGAMSRLSMLPVPMAAFLQSVPPPEDGQANAEAVTLGLSKWRSLSAFLLHPARSDRTALQVSEHGIAQQAASLSSALNTFLDVFVAPGEGSRADQKIHLEAVIAEVTRLGYVLLSQPSDFRFIHRPNSRTGVAVVCAGLDKLTAKNGTPLRVPQRLVDPEEVTLYDY